MAEFRLQVKNDSGRWVDVPGVSSFRLNIGDPFSRVVHIEPGQPFVNGTATPPPDDVEGTGQ